MCGHADAQLDDAQLDDAELDESSRGALLRGVRARSQVPARRSGHSRAAVALREPGDAHLGDAKLGDAKLDDAQLDESSRGALRRGVRARSQGPAGRRQRARAAPAGVVAQRGPGEAQLADAQLDDAQLDDAQLEAGTWGAEGLSWHTIAADALPRPGASIVERRTVCSLGRLRVLPGGGGALGRLRLGLCEGADWRADDVDVQFAEGPRSNRGNPNRPEAMRGVGTGGNPAGTDAMNQLRRVLMPCGTTGCTALVEKFAAAKQANAATRETLARPERWLRREAVHLGAVASDAVRSQAARVRSGLAAYGLSPHPPPDASLRARGHGCAFGGHCTHRERSHRVRPPCSAESHSPRSHRAACCNHGCIAGHVPSCPFGVLCVRDADGALQLHGGAWRATSQRTCVFVCCESIPSGCGRASSAVVSCSRRGCRAYYVCGGLWVERAACAPLSRRGGASSVCAAVATHKFSKFRRRVLLLLRV